MPLRLMLSKTMALLWNAFEDTLITRELNSGVLEAKSVGRRS